MSEQKDEKPSEDSCATCRFALRVDEDSWTCRRYPPVVALDSFTCERDYDRESSGSGSLYTSAEQPAVLATDWCGEWQPKRGG